MKIEFTTDLNTVSKMIADIKTTAGAHRHTVNQAIIGAIYQANTNRNADTLIKLQQTLMADSPRELNVFNKIVNKFACVALASESTTVGKFETKVVKGMLGDEKVFKSKSEAFSAWLETGMITIKNPAYVEGESAADVKKRIEVEFKDCFAFADYASGKKSDPKKPSMGEIQKTVFGKMKKDINLKAFDFLDGFLRNVLTQEGVAPEQRLNREQADKLIELINSKVK